MTRRRPATWNMRLSKGSQRSVWREPGVAMGKGEGKSAGRGAMGTDAPSSPVKQRGLYTQMLLFEES